MTDLPAFIEVCAFEDALNEADMVICHRGDGTILHIARSAALAGNSDSRYQFREERFYGGAGAGMRSGA
jgi:UDP-N-acetylglucosamine transferase subunit ALG13